jgi:hypothetical protein
MAARLHDFARTIAEIARRSPDRGVADLHARAAMLAGDLGRELSDKATGIAGFAAREIVAQIREALALLRDPDVARALGGGAPFALVSRWGPGLLGRPLAVSRRLDRATSGLALLRWIADGAANLDAAARAVGRGHPLVAAAETWLLADGGDA